MPVDVVMLLVRGMTPWCDERVRLGFCESGY